MEQDERIIFIALFVKSKNEGLNEEELNMYNKLFQQLYLHKCDRCNGGNFCIICGGSGIIGIMPYEISQYQRTH